MRPAASKVAAVAPAAQQVVATDSVGAGDPLEEGSEVEPPIPLGDGDSVLVVEAEEEDSTVFEESLTSNFSDGPVGEVIELGSTTEILPSVAKTKRSSKDLVPLDALSVYLRDLSKYPQLSREQEHELALKFFHDKDVQAAYQLVASNLWLVVKLARDYERAARNLLDLVQEGNIGLMEAVKNFDPYRGVRLPSYATWWIKAYIVRYVIANWRMVKIGTTQAQRKLFFNLKKEKERLEREGFIATPKLIADRLSVRESDVVEMEQRLNGGDVSVDAPLQTDSEATLLAVLPGPGRTAEEIVGQRELQQQVLKSFEEFSVGLKDNERVIFRERMLGEEKATLQDMAHKLSLSRERIRQIENRIREKLKVFLVERFGPHIEDMDVFES